MTLRRAAEQALAAIKSANQVNYSWACVEAVAVLEAALAEEALQRLTDVNQEIEAALAKPQRKPLSDEELEQAYRHIWSNIPENFDHTSIGWIEQGIRYAEQAHGIGEKHE